MRVTQKISIGSIRINSMSNTSIVQIGTSGAIKARSETTTEEVTQEVADQKVEKKIEKAVKPELKKEGLPMDGEENFKVEPRKEGQKKENRT
jgi:spore germination protein PB